MKPLKTTDYEKFKTNFSQHDDAILFRIICARKKRLPELFLKPDCQFQAFSVTVKNTKRTIQTDFDGKYSIKASKGETLIFSYIGYKTRSIIVGDKNVINVELKADATELESVVVTAQTNDSQSRNYVRKQRASEKSSVSIRGIATSPAIARQEKVKERRKDTIKNLPQVNVNDEDYGMFVEKSV